MVAAEASNQIEGAACEAEAAARGAATTAKGQAEKNDELDAKAEGVGAAFVRKRSLRLQQQLLRPLLVGAGKTKKKGEPRRW